LCAVIEKPGSAWLEGIPVRDLGHMNVVLKWMYLYGWEWISFFCCFRLKSDHPMGVVTVDSNSFQRVKAEDRSVRAMKTKSIKSELH